MEELYKDFEEANNKLHDVMHDYPLFKEDIDYIMEHDIKDINDLLERNDEYYLKKAIKQLNKLSDDLKTRSLLIDNLYDEFDKEVQKWNDGHLNRGISNSELDDINSYINKANDLINNHSVEDIKKAVELIKKANEKLKEY